MTKSKCHLISAVGVDILPIYLHVRMRPFKPSTESGIVVLFGNLAPGGCVIKQSAVTEEMRVFTGTARVFESENETLAALRANTVREGEVLVIRNEGPKGGPGMPETLAVTLSLSLSGFTQVALITDGRFSGATSGPCVGHVAPEAAEGRPIAVVRDGDTISIDIPARSIRIHLTDQELQARLAEWRPRPARPLAGYMRRYVKQVVSAAKGAYLD